ncbi:two-component system sensor histidine kinase NtrB [Elioraea thermophila]|uniref:two-component system sensor histidine kinase NtrB n=1 Tax=Elioraea thermophila TaxID=2185104 RepID=UPI000DF4B70C|nr:PAS domain S-box protein [Elioraea thermophila]
MPTPATDLFSSEEAFHELVRLAPIGICVTDRARRFVLVNPAYCRIYGYREDELLGREFILVLPEEDRAYAARLHDDFLDGRTDETPGEWRVLRKDGALRDILVDAARLVSPSGARFKLTTVQDITEEKKRESERFAREREGLIAAVAAIAGHDLNNTLSTVQLSIDFIEHGLADRPDLELLRAAVSDIKQVLERARALTGRLQAIALPTEQRRVPVDPVAECRRSLIGFADRVVFENALESPLTVMVDPWRFADAVVNLLTNACEATEAAGRRDPIVLRLRGAERTVNAADSNADATVAVEVIDRGLGIDPETVSRIFEPGFSTKRLNAAQRVRGIGMMSVRLFVEEAGGSVRVQSAPGQGTTVTLLLPARHVPAKTALVGSATAD